MHIKSFLSVPCLLFLISCSQPGQPSQPSADKPAAASIVDGNAIKAHIQKLSSDEMEGRAPGSKGEELATTYIADYFKSIGLKTFFQGVPLVGVTSTVSPMKLSGAGSGRMLKYADEFVAWSKQQKPSISADAELVFAGYGVVAPEYQWNDFKGANVKGKIIVVLINDPQLEDQTKFGGKAMTYYGRWTYKFEEAARQGAAGALIVHETEFAGYPWEVVRGSWSGEQFDMVYPDKGASTVPIQGWITRDVAMELFKTAGQDFEDLKKKALQPDFKAVPLGIRASVDVKNKLRTVESKNVLGVLEGQVPEYVVFTAHWDHLGIGEPQNGDKIYNGAEDNASGVAMIMDIARAFTKVQPKPKRSIVFLAVTAEEQGLLGSLYYSENPVFPLNKTVANINIDGINLYGRDKNEVHVVGYGYTTLEDTLKDVLSKQGRSLVPEDEPEKGFYFRSDQFSFARKGVPALYAESTTVEDSKEYTEHRYHKPSDEYNPNWDMKAAVRDGDALFEVVERVANSDQWPEWKPGTEFRAIREQMLKK
ncbi:MAG: peptidase M28 [Acidobacteria bacterium]|nr:MAG: peptidase M28 [Acidobacteriota bacterium]